MHRFIVILVIATLPIAANANLPEPLKSYKNNYISCIKTVSGETLNAGDEVTESLLLTSCPNELASLKAAIPINMQAIFSQQLRQEVKATVYKQVSQSD